MAMTKPSITKLLTKADCRYTLVCMVAKRARQLVGGSLPLIDTKEIKPVTISVDEVDRGLISYERQDGDAE